LPFYINFLKILILFIVTIKFRFLSPTNEQTILMLNQSLWKININDNRTQYFGHKYDIICTAHLYSILFLFFYSFPAAQTLSSSHPTVPQPILQATISPATVSTSQLNLPSSSTPSISTNPSTTTRSHSLLCKSVMVGHRPPSADLSVLTLLCKSLSYLQISLLNFSLPAT